MLSCELSSCSKQRDPGKLVSEGSERVCLRARSVVAESIRSLSVSLCELVPVLHSSAPARGVLRRVLVAHLPIP